MVKWGDENSFFWGGNIVETGLGVKGNVGALYRGRDKGPLRRNGIIDQVLKPGELDNIVKLADLLR